MYNLLPLNAIQSITNYLIGVSLIYWLALFFQIDEGRYYISLKETNIGNTITLNSDVYYLRYFKYAHTNIQNHNNMTHMLYFIVVTIT